MPYFPVADVHKYCYRAPYHSTEKKQCIPAKTVGKSLKSKYSLDRHMKASHPEEMDIEETHSSEEESVEQDESSVWESIRTEVDSEFEERIDAKMNEGSGFTRKEAYELLLPLICRRYAHLLTERIQEHLSMQQDPLFLSIEKAHEKIVKNDGLDKDDAWDAAVNKKHYLIEQKLESMLEAETEEDDVDDDDNETEQSGPEQFKSPFSA